MKVRRHPILGFFAGIFLGLGIAVTLFVFGVIPMTAVWLGALALGFAVLGIVGAYAVPARGRSAAAPPPAAKPAPPTIEASE